LPFAFPFPLRFFERFEPLRADVLLFISESPDKLAMRMALRPRTATA